MATVVLSACLSDSGVFVVQHVYRASILSENMVYNLVRTLKIEHVELEKNAASALFQVDSRPY